MPQRQFCDLRDKCWLTYSGVKPAMLGDKSGPALCGMEACGEIEKCERRPWLLAPTPAPDLTGGAGSV